MAKPELREQARRLRVEGRTVPAIAAELGVARSTAFLWVRDLPLPDTDERAARRRDHSKRMTDSQWSAHRADRDARHAASLAANAASVGELSDREVLLLGAAIYWCEGAKAKPWRPTDWRVTFTNSDAAMVELFLRFMEAVGRPREQLRYRISIHETADVARARGWWADRLGLQPELLGAVTLKRHRPAPGRHNLGADYRGCLVVTVPRGTEVYWKIEGLVAGLAASGRAGSTGRR